jgi:RNA polymerase sigma-70 factor (sigma-E family)
MKPTGADWERDFAEYVSGRTSALRRTAYLLCGDWHRADDLTQQALTKVYLAWRRIRTHDALDGYVRRTLVNTFLDERRRPWRREVVTGELPDRPAPRDLADERLELLAALARLPRTQRAALVLRYWEDLSIAETAEVLGIREGTVKSSTARGLAALREVLQGSRSGEPAR